MFGGGGAGIEFLATVLNFIYISDTNRYANLVRFNKNIDIKIDAYVSKQKTSLVIISCLCVIKVLIVPASLLFIVIEMILKLLFWTKIGNIASINRRGNFQQKTSFEINKLILDFLNQKEGDRLKALWRDAKI